METTKININVDQNEAIKIGKNQYGKTIIDIDPANLTDNQRISLATCWKDGGSGIPCPQNDFSAMPKVGEATIDIAKMLLDAWSDLKAQRDEAKKHEIEKTILNILSRPFDEWFDCGRWGGEKPKMATMIGTDGAYSRENISKYINDARIAIRYEEAKNELSIRQEAWEQKQAELKRQNEERDRREAEIRANNERARAVDEAAKRQQIADYLAAHGSDNQKKRAALNLLPDKEVLGMMRDEAFAPLADFERYQKITTHDIIGAGYCDCDDDYADADRWTFDVNDATEATAEDFETMEKIMDLMPGATVTLREHQGYCDTCYEKDDEMIIIRNSIRVAVTVGAFGFTREYAV